MCCSLKYSSSFLAASGSSAPFSRNVATSAASEATRAFTSGSSSSSAIDSGKNARTVVASGARKVACAAPSRKRSFSASSSSMELAWPNLRSTPIFSRVSKRKGTLTSSSRASSLILIWTGTLLYLSLTHLGPSKRNGTLHRRLSWYFLGTRLPACGRSSFFRREIGAVRMMEYQRAHAGLGLHHHAFGEIDADVLGTEQREQALLIVQIGTSRIAEAVALAAIFRGEAVVHGEGGRIGEAPILADAAVEPFRGALSRLNGQRLDGVRLEELAGLLPRLGSFADAGPRRHHEQRQVIAAAVLRFENIIAQA